MEKEDIVKNTLDFVPSPKADAKSIVGLVKQGGRVTGYQLSGGETITKSEAVSLAKQGGIKGVGIAHRKDTEYLKAVPNGSEQDNLSNLPSISAKL